MEAINGTPLETPLHWKARALKLDRRRIGEPAVRRNREIRELKLSAAPSHVLQKGFTVGLSLRNALEPGRPSRLSRRDRSPTAPVFG